MKLSIGLIALTLAKGLRAGLDRMKNAKG